MALHTRYILDLYLLMPLCRVRTHSLVCCPFLLRTDPQYLQGRASRGLVIWASDALLICISPSLGGSNTLVILLFWLFRAQIRRSGPPLRSNLQECGMLPLLRGHRRLTVEQTPQWCRAILEKRLRYRDHPARHRLPNEKDFCSTCSLLVQFSYRTPIRLQSNLFG